MSPAGSYDRRVTPDATLYAILLTHVPGVATDRGVIDRHIAHLRALDDRGALVLAGPMLDSPRGLVIVRAADRAEAERIATADPFVVEGVRAYEVITWLLATRENGYLA